MKNIALLSPNQNAYSETFIQAHKKMLAGNIHYYFNGLLPTELEDGLVINSRKSRIVDIVKGHYRLNKFSLEEQALITSFKNNAIDLVFAEYGGTGEKIIPVCKALDLPLIVHFHGYDISQKDQLEKNDYYKMVFKYASYIVGVSKKMIDDLLQIGCPKEKLIYSPCGVREEFFELTPNFNSKQFLAAGRFVNKKAPYYLILAFQKVLLAFPDARLKIAGEGELWNTCKNLIHFHGLDKSIELLGVVDSRTFKKCLEGSIAFVQHSITAEDGDAEGTPVTILEASAAGLPIISTRHAGIPDVVIEDETGLLVDEHDVNGMAEYMIRLLEDRELASKMGDRARQNVKANFSLKMHIDKLNSIIEKANKRNRK
jgi:colanic acid/amylovoran biosynthesis glycosyltransferase